MDEHPRLGKGHAIVLIVSVSLISATFLIGFWIQGAGFIFVALNFASLGAIGGLLGGLVGGYGAWNRYKQQHQKNTGVYTDKVRPGYLLFWVWVGILVGGPLGLMTFFEGVFVGEYLALLTSQLISWVAFIAGFILLPVIPGLIVLFAVVILDWNIRPLFNYRIAHYGLVFLGGILFFCISTVGFTLPLYYDNFAELESSSAFTIENPEWFLLPKPPTEVVKLVAIRPFTIFVETEDNKLMGCPQASKLETDCWFEVSSIPEEPEALCEFVSEFPGMTQLYKIEQHLQKDYCQYGLGGEYNYASFHYVLLDNGDVWQWGFDDIGLADAPQFENARKEVIKKAYGIGLLGGSVLSIMSIFISLGVVQMRKKET